MSPREVRPTTKGADLSNKDSSLDAHIRTEKQAGKCVITVDLFDSTEEDPDAAHVESEAFGASKKGAKDAEAFLRDNGFSVTVKPPKKC